MQQPTHLGLTNHEWVVALVGLGLGIVATILIGFVTGLRDVVLNWWRNRQPVHLLLQRLSDKNEPIIIYARDFEALRYDATTGLFHPISLVVREPLNKEVGTVANVPVLWSRVEATAYGAVLYVLSIAGKTRPIEVVEMSKDTGRWDAGIVVLGAQTERCYQFYKQMTGVAYSMDKNGIYDQSGNALEIDGDSEDVDEYRYGFILKCRNPLRTQGGPGTAFLIGGFGVEGTEAAGYYFRTRYRELTRLFGDRTFGVVVRVHKDASAETATRMPQFDCATEKKAFWTRRVWELAPWARTQVDIMSEVG